MAVRKAGATEPAEVESSGSACGRGLHARGKKGWTAGGPGGDCLGAAVIGACYEHRKRQSVGNLPCGFNLGRKCEQGGAGLSPEPQGKWVPVCASTRSSMEGQASHSPKSWHLQSKWINQPQPSIYNDTPRHSVAHPCPQHLPTMLTQSQGSPIPNPPTQPA